jgi:hypothetical protein
MDKSQKSKKDKASYFSFALFLDFYTLLANDRTTELCKGQELLYKGLCNSTSLAH